MPTKSLIQDHSFLFTGALTEFTRAEADALVKDNGGAVVSGVTSKLNYLVVGADAGSKLDKAKALGTVKILTEKEFLKMVPKGKATAKKPAAKKMAATKPAAKKMAATKPAARKATTEESTPKKSKSALTKNEIQLNCRLSEFEKLIKKTKGKLEYKDYDGKVIQLIKKVADRNDEELYFKRGREYFIYIESENVLLIAFSMDKSVYERCKIEESFFASLASLTDYDFKVDVWDMESRELHFCRYKKGKLQYASDDEEMWYIDFDGYPYFEKTAKSRGFKKIKNEDGERDYTSDDKYSVIYDFVDDLLNGIGADNIAPDWYVKD